MAVYACCVGILPSGDVDDLQLDPRTGDPSAYLPAQSATNGPALDCLAELPEGQAWRLVDLVAMTATAAADEWPARTALNGNVGPVPKVLFPRTIRVPLEA